MLSKLATRVGAVVGIGCTIHCFFEYVCDFVVCTGKWSMDFCDEILFDIFFLGESMQPTLYANDILICDKSARKYEAKYSRNDIVSQSSGSSTRNRNRPNVFLGDLYPP